MCTIKIAELSAAVKKVQSAIGKEDVIKLRFEERKGKSFAVLSAFDCKTLEIEAKVPVSACPDIKTCYVKGSTFGSVINLLNCDMNVAEAELQITDSALEIKDGSNVSTFARVVAGKSLADDLRDASGNPVSVQKYLVASGKGRMQVPLKALTDAVKAVGYSASTKAPVAGIYFDATGEAGEDTIFHLYASDSSRGAHAAFKATTQLADETVTFKDEAGEEKTESRPRPVSALSFNVGMSITSALAAMSGDVVDIAVATGMIMLRDGCGCIATIALGNDEFAINSIKLVCAPKEKLAAKDSRFGRLAEMSCDRAELIGALNLCDILSVTAEGYAKAANLSITPNGEVSRLTIKEIGGKAKRELGAKVDFDETNAKKAQEVLVENGVVMGIRFLKEALMHMTGDKIDITIGQAFVCIFDGSDIPAAFVFLRNK